jgi:hypothetical protein
MACAVLMHQARTAAGSTPLPNSTPRSRLAPPQKSVSHAASNRREPSAQNSYSRSVDRATLRLEKGPAMGKHVRTVAAGALALAIAGTAGLSQEESCASALDSRRQAGETVAKSVPRFDTTCADLRERLDAFVAAEAALRTAHRAVRRACPAGEFVRADSDAPARSEFIIEAARSRLAKCLDPTSK